ncbi:hypothetical protein CNEO2_30021 [Clostridium neonatale]|uniref:Uncharacterized protein n=1 Tax=Clostridium neonatale TaxID=137838 RepID=A0AAD1YBD9_9CLOT|nr:hypothetical protein CNEO2_100021 [Clostridium neonatale]CAI3671517.1 hypothetical protein CNEO2_30021 [Clostridium neonatale]
MSINNEFQYIIKKSNKEYNYLSGKINYCFLLVSILLLDLSYIPLDFI